MRVTGIIGNERLIVIGSILGAIFCGTVGLILFKIGINKHGDINLNILSLFKLVSNPYILGSLGLMFFGRMLHSIPLSKYDIGKFSLILTPLSLIVTIVSGVILFGESYTIIQLIGMVLGLIAVWMMG